MYRDRTDAGYVLGGRLAALGLTRPVVLALPRGGVPVAAEVARRLAAPLGLLFVRKLGVPGQEEIAAGAVALGPRPVTVFNPDVLRVIGRTEADFAAAVARAEAENADRKRRWLGQHPQPEVTGADVVVVDDGLATGATARAALLALRAMGPRRIVMAVPVGAPEACAAIAPLADDLVCAESPEPFVAVGAHYRAFPQVADDEVTECLRAAGCLPPA